MILQSQGLYLPQGTIGVTQFEDGFVCQNFATAPIVTLPFQNCPSYTSSTESTL